MTKEKTKLIKQLSAGILFIGLVFVFSGCSLFEIEKVEKLSDSEAAIQKLFMAKYPGYKFYSVLTDKEDATHIKGRISLCPGDPCIGGAFLAVKKNNDWELVFDAVESNFYSDPRVYYSDPPCEIETAFGFPQDMMSDCLNPACTKEAKLCPDGTGVARRGPDCEFMPCSK